MQKTALITGIAGQDGSYLTQLLLNKGYIVHGVTRDEAPDMWRHAWLGIKTVSYQLHTLDLTDRVAVFKLIEIIKPTEVYHLAAQSSVAKSIHNPYPTLHFTTVSTLTLLDVICSTDKNIKFFHASSSEIFGTTSTEALTTLHPIIPTTPYGVAKASAHLMVQNYRSVSGLFAVNGILFPHESPLRHPDAFTKSLIRQALAVKSGSAHSIVLGQTANKRDFGHAKDYVEAMWLTLKADQADDHIIGTGIATQIRDLAMYACTKIGIPQTVITNDTRAQSELVTAIIADTTETTKKISWSARTTIFATLDELIEFEIDSPVNKT